MNGGYEDWAYGASWDLVNVPQTCNSSIKNKVDPYPAESNRAFVFLVEAGDKIPKAEKQGNELSLFYPDDPKSIYGNVSRNMNLIFTFAEMMNPFLVFKNIQIEQEKLILDMELRGCR